MTPFVMVRLILAAAVMVAAVLKSYQLATEPVGGGSLLSSRWPLIVVVECEFAMAAWLLTGFAPSALRWAGPVFFAALGGVALAKVWAGDASCGCLGRWTISPWGAMAFDAGAVAALYGTSRRASPQHDAAAGRRPAAAAYSLMAVLALSAGVAMARYEPARLADDGRVVGVGRHVSLLPDHWVGRRFPLREHVQIACDLEAASWVVVLVQPDCRLCQEVASQYRRIARDWTSRADGPRLALISLPDDSATDGEGDERMVTTASAVVGRLSDRFIWHVTVPVELTLRDGIVTRVRSATSPRVEDFDVL